MISDKNKTNLKVAVRIIDMIVGAAIALICFTALTFIENVYIRFGIIVWVILISVVSYVLYILNEERKKEKISKQGITKVTLLNEENKAIQEWSLIGQVSVVIGKGTFNDKVFIDLNESVYSPLIDNNHAVLNYAQGNWYVEDISSDKVVAIKKAEDDNKYNVVKGSPCTIKRGDIIYISKVKLLLD